MDHGSAATPPESGSHQSRSEAAYRPDAPEGRIPPRSLEDLGGGLFSCLSDRNLCLRATFLPCSVFADNASHKDVDEGRWSECCCAYLLCNADAACVLAGWLRGRIQRGLGLREESPCTNTCTHCCCYPCAVSQEARALRAWDERRARGLIPSMGRPARDGDADDEHSISSADEALARQEELREPAPLR